VPAPTDISSASRAAADPVAALHRALQSAIARVLGEEYADADPVLVRAQKPEFGDFQANCAMAVAKRVQRKPRDLAQEIVNAADISAIAEPPEIAGPGFINIRLKGEAIASALDAMDDESLGLEPSSDTHAVVIDMCAVNVAKQMHVGHLRSTIIGDALARVFERRGRRVFRENHLGDWGLPIAMVLHELREQKVNLEALELADLDRAYRAAQLSTKPDESGLEAARKFGAGPHRIIELEEQNASAAEALAAAKATLLKLQRGDAELHRDWNKLIDCTMRALFQAIRILHVNLGPEHNRGESFYRDRLDGVVAEFEKKGIAREDQGALVVPFPDRERPLIIRKSDGAYLYATTDLAAVRFRARELNADRIIYVVDARQRDHFKDVFDAARMIGWAQTPDGTDAELIHIGFGSVLGLDKTPLKTRSGENVTLQSLLDEACARGEAEVIRRAGDSNAPTHGLPIEELKRIGRAVGIGAVKFADLSNDLVRDYVFDMDRMIAFEGNTGPYLQYAHARICSIFTKAGLDPRHARSAAIHIMEHAERQLALVLLRYGRTIADVARTLEPHRLCSYLSDLANAYNTFYQQCPVLKAEDDSIRASRLRLCALVKNVLADGLDLLGIEAPERM